MGLSTLLLTNLEYAVLQRSSSSSSTKNEQLKNTLKVALATAQHTSARSEMVRMRFKLAMF